MGSTKKYKISIVSYFNTIPLLYGLENSGIINEDVELFKDVPSQCANKLLNDEIDLGLVPIATIPRLKYHKIISDFCIGADGPVTSVKLFSKCSIDSIKNVHLDAESRTSNLLVKVLAKNYWEIKPAWLQANSNYESSIQGNTAGLIIGDRAFNYNEEFDFQFDLAEAWKEYTDLPFVFACWIANKKIPQSFIDKFNEAQEFGLNNIEKAIKKYCTNPHFDINSYLTNSIQFNLDKRKIKAMDKFLNLAQEFVS